MTGELELQKNGERRFRLFAKFSMLLLLLATGWLWWDSYRNQTGVGGGFGLQIVVLSTSGRVVLASDTDAVMRPRFEFMRTPDENGDGYRSIKGSMQQSGWPFVELHFLLIMAVYVGVLRWLFVRARRIRASRMEGSE